ncbi:MAG: type I restriction-modification system subunit M N-terminal domain-containing protein [Candidatus Nanopelagicales bacterium]
MDPGDFKNCVFPMLFWKWLSDAHAWERAQAVEEFGSDVDPEVEADYHRFALPAGTSWAEVTTTTSNLGHAIQTAFSRIQQANPQTLAGVFGDAAWANKERLPEASLVNLVQAFQGLRWTRRTCPTTCSAGPTSTCSRCSPTPPARRPASSSHHARSCG